MNETKEEKIFVNGLFTFDVADTEPEFVLGRGSFQVDSLIEFLKTHKQYAIDGYLRFDILRSASTNKRYAELNLYEYRKQNGGESKADKEFKSL